MINLSLGFQVLVDDISSVKGKQLPYRFLIFTLNGTSSEQFED